jgi:signal peptidase
VVEGKKGKSFLSSIKAFIVAPLIFLIVLGSVFAYSGIWPPMVVIESKSMQHSSTMSYLGTADTGDIVIVKKVTSLGEVETYVDGVASGHATYGEYGDVVIYYKGGMVKPIIHRAIVNLEYNETGGGFDVPSLAKIPDWMWAVPSAETKTYYNLQQTLVLYDVGYMGATVTIDLKSMLNVMQAEGDLHGGLITMGDNNWKVNTDGTISGSYDQVALEARYNVREPIKEEWVIGKARGELPWFGLLKLYATGSAPSYTPENSRNNLVISLILIIGVPVVLDVSNSILKTKGIYMFKWTEKLVPKRWRKEQTPPKEPPKE